MEKELRMIQNEYGGGLSLSVTNKYTSVRHELALLDENKKTAGEVVKLINKEFKINTSVNELKSLYFDLNGRLPEWHHSGMFKKTMGKTFFFNLEEIELLRENISDYHTPKLSKKEKELLESKKKKFIKKYNGKEFNRIQINEVSKYSVIIKEEMHGKYGYFEYNSKYNSVVYYSGVTFKSEKTKQKFINTYLNYKKEK